MNFFKKIFSKKEKVGVSSKNDVFVCKNCEKEYPVSQKKDSVMNGEANSKDVCEFC